MNESYDRSIISSIQKIAGTYNIDTVTLLTGNVTSVDEAAGTCSVEAISGNASTSINNVEFQAVVSDGILIIPKIDSEVKVAFSKYTQPFIVQYSEIDKIYFAAELIHFNNGDLGGMVKVIDLTTKLNNLENKVNSILTAFNTHLHTSTVPSTPTTPPLAPIAGVLTPTQQADIENTLIIQ